MATAAPPPRPLLLPGLNLGRYLAAAPDRLRVLSLYLLPPHSGDGYSTTLVGNRETSKIQVEGATSGAQCAVDKGYQFVNGKDDGQGVAACTRGNYKELYGPGACERCPAGARPCGPSCRGEEGRGAKGAQGFSR